MHAGHDLQEKRQYSGADAVHSMLDETADWLSDTNSSPNSDSQSLPQRTNQASNGPGTGMAESPTRPIRSLMSSRPRSEIPNPDMLPPGIPEPRTNQHQAGIKLEAETTGNTGEPGLNAKENGLAHCIQNGTFINKSRPAEGNSQPPTRSAFRSRLRSSMSRPANETPADSAQALTESSAMTAIEDVQGLSLKDQGMAQSKSPVRPCMQDLKEILSWSPKHKSFESFMLSSAEDFYSTSI